MCPSHLFMNLTLCVSVGEQVFDACVTLAQRREAECEALVFGSGAVSIMDQLTEAAAHMGHKIGAYKTFIQMMQAHDDMSGGALQGGQWPGEKGQRTGCHVDAEGIRQGQGERRTWSTCCQGLPIEWQRPADSVESGHGARAWRIHTFCRRVCLCDHQTTKREIHFRAHNFPRARFLLHGRSCSMAAWEECLQEEEMGAHRHRKWAGISEYGGNFPPARLCYFCWRKATRHSLHWQV